MHKFSLHLWTIVLGCSLLRAADIAAVTDQTTYNAGSEVHIRLLSGMAATASIRYAGEDSPIATDIAVHGSTYMRLWTIPSDARTGRYLVDLFPSDGKPLSNATSFAVHRQLAKVLSVELDKTFYTSGDRVRAHIVIGNVSNRPLENIHLEFEPYTYPWIALAPDEPPMWKHVVAPSVSLAPGIQKAFDVADAVVIQAGAQPAIAYYSVVLRDSRDADIIYDLAFAPPAFVRPPNTLFPKEYPFLYLYQRLSDLSHSETYRHFYSPRFESDVIDFDTSHTLFSTSSAPVVSFSVKEPNGTTWSGAAIRILVIDQTGKTVRTARVAGVIAGKHEFSLEPVPPGVYRVQASIELTGGTVVAQNETDLAVNPLPRSILVFCAHEDDETAHHGLIRAAVENHIPIRFVYLTGGDAGGCDRFYMHSCDAARAMDFGEVRMAEARASLGHLGVPGENIYFLGLPDGGLGQIWDRHKKANQPYLSVLLASDHAPYRETAIPNLPYARESVVSAAKQFILRFRPEMILTGHPDERHVDHRVGNWIVVKAMQDLLREGAIPSTTKLLVDTVYGASPAKRAPYHYEKQTFYVSGEAARIGQEARWYYQSQDGNHDQANITEFEKLPREEAYPHFQILDWQAHEGWNELSHH